MDGVPFGRYQLMDLLGRGGMGEVWRAFDTVTERMVALKALPADLADDETYQIRFRREAKAAAGLTEPHVVPIYDYGEIDGRLFVTMRVIDGEDLQEIIKRGPLEPTRAVGIIEQIAAALHAAHRIGLVHRDVKPSNILIAENDFAYLIDFGIARSHNDSDLTKAGALVGTWSYMAPERFGAKPVDARADIYALTCVLYEAVTGHPPFPVVSIEQIVTAHMVQPPPRPSALRDDIPQEMDGVIATGMAKARVHRYSTTMDMASAARAAISGEPVPESGAKVLRLGPTADEMLTVVDTGVEKGADRGTAISLDAARPRFLLFGGIGVVVVAVIAVASIALSNRGSGDAKPTAADISPSSTALRSVTIAPTPSARGNRTVALPLGLDDIKRIMNQTDLNGGQISTSLNFDQGDTFSDCEGIFTFADKSFFGDTGFNEFASSFISDSDMLGFTVSQDIFKYGSDAKAEQVVDSFASSWSACRGKTVTRTYSDGTGSETAVVGEVVVGEHQLRADYHLTDGGDMHCRHLVESISDYVIEVYVCDDYLLADKPQTIASEIGAKITGS